MSLDFNSPTIDQDIAKMFYEADVNKTCYEYKDLLKRGVYTTYSMYHKIGYAYTERKDMAEVEGLIKALKEHTNERVF